MRRTATPWLSAATSLSRIASNASPCLLRRKRYTSTIDATTHASAIQNVTLSRVALSMPRSAVRLVPEPPPTMLAFANDKRNTSAITHVPIAK